MLSPASGVIPAHLFPPHVDPSFREVNLQYHRNSCLIDTAYHGCGQGEAIENGPSCVSRHFEAIWALS